MTYSREETAEALKPQPEKEDRCPRCNQNLHTSWDQTSCSFCGSHESEPGVVIVVGPRVTICKTCAKQALEEVKKIERVRQS